MDKIHPLAIVLDQFIGRHDMTQMLPALRRAYPIPILMLSSNTDETDRILSLESGADDYISKVAHPREILARISGCVRRYQRPAHEDPIEVPATGAGDSVVFKGWTLYRGSGYLTSPTRQIAWLPPQEAAMAWLLFSSPHTVITRDQVIRNGVPAHVPLTHRRIDNLVSRLQKRFEALGARLDLRVTRHIGYSLNGIRSAKDHADAMRGARAKTSGAGE